MLDFWILVQHRDNEVDPNTYGLVTEARRLIRQLDVPGRITAVALGPVAETALELLGTYGVGRVLHAAHTPTERADGEVHARALCHLVNREQPACVLMAQSAETEDLAPRTAAVLNTALVTRVMDFSMAADGTARAVRPVANGYLFEDVVLATKPAPIVLFLPSVLFDTAPDQEAAATVNQVALPDPEADLHTRIVDVIEAAPEELDLEEADIIVAAGRGVGKGDAFEVIHALARAVGGSVGATRPIIDRGILPYERQIGQTGKTVAPRLIINCGISGANEYTAGMEKTRRVIAIDRNPGARIFRFADLGVVGDVHAILPLLIAHIEDRK